MRKPQWVLVGLLLVSAAAPSHGQSCGAPAPVASARLHDRGWIRSDAVIYGTNMEQGVFRIGLGVNTIAAIGSHAGRFPVEAFELSPRKTWLHYVLSDA